MNSITHLTNYIPHLYENFFIEWIKYLLICILLVVCIANTANKKINLVQQEKVRKSLSTLDLVQDEPVRKRRSTLEKSISHTSFECTYEYFCQENREYVKNWKKELVNRQLFEMWCDLDEKERKEWVNKAEDLVKLFDVTNNTKMYKNIVIPKMRKMDAELCKQITGHDSAEAYFLAETDKFLQFFKDYLYNEPTTVNISSWVTHACSNTTILQKAFQQWIECDSDRKKIRYKILKTITVTYFHYGKATSFAGNIVCEKNTWNKIGSDNQKEWQYAYDSFVNAYELFCQKVRRIDPEMSDDVDDHLYRMWEINCCF
jgi:hypothetical protein